MYPYYKKYVNKQTRNVIQAGLIVKVDHENCRIHLSLDDPGLPIAINQSRYIYIIDGALKPLWAVEAKGGSFPHIMLNKEFTDYYELYSNKDKVLDRFEEIIKSINLKSFLSNMYIKLSTPIEYEDRLVDFYLQVKCNGKCNVTGEPQTWSGRKWMLSEHMTDQEIVQTAFKAVLTAIEHEVRELFTYKGVTVFDPHYDIEKLVELRKQPDSVVERKKP